MVVHQRLSTGVKHGVLIIIGSEVEVPGVLVVECHTGLEFTIFDPWLIEIAFMLFNGQNPCRKALHYAKEAHSHCGRRGHRGSGYQHTIDWLGL